MFLRAMKLSGLVTGLLLAGSMVPACEGTEAPEGLWMTQRQGGPRVVFDLFNRPLPEVPLPNDIATRPDPTSPTGRRINASQLAPTGLEEGVRARLDRVDGWGTYGAITVSFEPVDQLLDIGNIMRRHIGDDFDFTDDAIYLVNIDRDSSNFGVPVPLDIGEGNFPVNLEQRDRYYDNDPRGHTSNLMFETTYEDSNGNGELDLMGGGWTGWRQPADRFSGGVLLRLGERLLDQGQYRRTGRGQSWDREMVQCRRFRHGWRCRHGHRWPRWIRHSKLLRILLTCDRERCGRPTDRRSRWG